MSEENYFRKGLGNKDEVAPLLHADYHSGLVQYFRRSGYRLDAGNTTIRLAREFGFCYGVDRAVEYAYECRERFPDRRLWITGEIIHNPWVNRRLEEMGIRFLPPASTGTDRLAGVDAEDVVLIPAFGMENEEFRRLRDRGVILVDTTCGSVLSVWKSVERYAREGFTAVVHGKMQHEETLATCSQVRKYADAHYLVVRDEAQAAWVCEFIEGRLGSDELLTRLDGSYSDGFRPEAHLRKIGLANQTTMLSSESLHIQKLLRDAMVRATGTEDLASRFKSFDTICSATQDRQDAVRSLLEEKIDLMLVIGGFNSSNTTHLLEMCLPHTRAYHVEDAACLISSIWIRHKPLGDHGPVVQDNWLTTGALAIGITAGASTPDREVGATIARVLSFRGTPTKEIEELSRTGSALESEASGATTRGGPPVIRP
ncbi:MAG: 4-hydroxy-3-methylbut-2-enyl diphosphate reductase [Candidatus Eisenbacteria bacterium]|uniref:4-hydroxy-3-methylbut-2-enyl diphosphate reductase n=1 Tax=Eiseniibacteriota bacterium TaxID=2212470 RepID=A0A956M2S8_UNCEI|nr:4-hydroxy-3-methylbut-2-enyl diphosphate reductase [Candidatus Eisenbacteria bacterium]